MFPPTPTTNPHELLNNMWLSVSRAGPAFTENAKVIPRDGVFECVLYMAPGGITPNVKKHLTTYMRQYVRASGWRVKSLRFTPRYAALLIASSSDASRASKNP